MRKPIVLLDLILLLAVVGLAAGIRTSWRRNHARYTFLPASSVATRPLATAGGEAVPARLVDYSEFVNRNLFSVDRNNVQPVVKKEKRQKPALPFLIGTLDLGGGMVALMADAKQAAKGSFRRLKVGEEIGEYKVVEIAEHKVVLEFDDEKTTIDVYESAASLSPAVAGAVYAPSPASQVQTVGEESGAAAGTPVAIPGFAPAQGGVIQSGGSLIAAPTHPEGVTIEGDFRVTRKMTAFGMMTYREPITPQPKAK